MNARHVSLALVLAVASVIGCNKGGGGAAAGGPAGKKDPLFLAARNNDAATIRAMSDQGEDVNAAMRNGTTPLHYAATEGNYDAARALLDAGANPPAQNSPRGETPLMQAANRGYTKIVEAMLAKKPNLNIQNRDGKTALMYAADRGSIDIVRMLVKAGADAKIVDAKGNTAVDHYAKGNPAVLAALRGE